MQVNHSNPYQYNNPSFKGSDLASIKNAPETASWGWNKEERRQEIKEYYKSTLADSSLPKKISNYMSKNGIESYERKFETECNIASFIERYKDALFSSDIYTSSNEQTDDDIFEEKIPVPGTISRRWVWDKEKRTLGTVTNYEYKTVKHPDIKITPETTSWGWNKKEREEELIKEYNRSIAKYSWFKKHFTDCIVDDERAYARKFQTECNIVRFLERYKDVLRPENLYAKNTDKEVSDCNFEHECAGEEIKHTPDAFDYGYTTQKPAETDEPYEIVWDLNKEDKENIRNLMSKL